MGIAKPFKELNQNVNNNGGKSLQSILIECSMRRSNCGYAKSSVLTLSTRGMPYDDNVADEKEIRIRRKRKNNNEMKFFISMR